MLNENNNDPSANGFKDVEGNGNSHPMNRQDMLSFHMGTKCISLPSFKFNCEPVTFFELEDL